MLYDEKSETIICDIYEHFGLPTLEFNSMQPRNQAKTTPWLWHSRLGHCRPEMIDQLKKYDDLKVNKSNNIALKTVQCTTCAVSKMHQLINRESTGRTMKSYQMLHFDLTILNKGFDGTSCIAHFTDEFTSYS